MHILLLSTGLVALAEIGDKTQLLSFVLGAQFRAPWTVCAGILVATLLNHGLAGGLGYALGESIPRAAVGWITGASFLAFGLWALRPDRLEGSARLVRGGVLVTSAIAFFFAEMGDKTQLTTAALAAEFRAPIEVVLGTTLGMLLADVPAVWLGDKLAQRVPLRLVRWVSAALFLGLGALVLARTAGRNL